MFVSKHQQTTKPCRNWINYWWNRWWIWMWKLINLSSALSSVGGLALFDLLLLILLRWIVVLTVVIYNNINTVERDTVVDNNRCFFTGSYCYVQRRSTKNPPTTTSWGAAINKEDMRLSRQDQNTRFDYFCASVRQSLFELNNYKNKHRHLLGIITSNCDVQLWSLWWRW